MPDVHLNIEVPLDDGTTPVVAHDGMQTIRTSHTYQADGFSTYHNASCLQEPKFQEAYELGVKSGHTLTAPGQELHCEWCVHQYIWAASHCNNLEGDFVECGVKTGIFSLAIMKYLNWNSIDKDFWLFDFFEGCPADQYTANEIANGVDKIHEKSYYDCYDLAKKNFAPWSRAKLVKGRVSR